MSELQNNSDVSEAPEQTEVENQDNGVELATTSEAEHESQPQVDEEAVKQEAIQKAINKKHFEAQQAKRDLEAANKRIEEFEAKKREEMAAQVGNIPPMPDAFDDDYELKVKQRDEALIAQANYNTQNQVYLQQQQQIQQQERLKQQQDLAKLANDFTSNAKKAGGTEEELNSVVTTLNGLGMTEELGKAIMVDADGFVMARYLAANPLEAESIINANPYMAGAKFADIKAKAGALKPKTSSAPTPPAKLSGNGVDKEAGYFSSISGAKLL